MTRNQNKASCHHIVVDAFAPYGSQHFAEYVGASIGCWVPTQNKKPYEMIEARLATEGWEIASVITRAQVNQSDYKSKTSGKREYEQALADGFSAHVHRRIREAIFLGESRDVDFSREYIEAIDQLKRSCYSLYSRADEQWANGVTPDGDDFVPLWTSSNEALKWLDYWPNHSWMEVPFGAMLGENGILSGLSGSEMWIGLGSKSVIFMVHPSCLQRDLQVQESQRG